MATTEDQRTGRVAIIGGSISGLTAGLALLQQGWDVRIYEASDEKLDQRGAGIITHAALFNALEALGISDRNNIGISILRRKSFSRDGEVIHDLELPQISTSWGRIYKLLRQHFPDSRYQRGKVLVGINQHRDDVDIHFSDGSEDCVDVLVGADGIRSTVRHQIEPAAKPHYAGYVAWRGLIDECDLSATERSNILPYFTFCLPVDEQVLTYPIAGTNHETDPGRRRCNVVWYRPAASDSTLIDMLTDVDGHNNGVSIAPDKVQPSVIKAMQNDAERLLSPQHTQLIRKLDCPFLQPIYDLTTSSMVHQRIALIGDAAYTARPHLAVGVTKAMDDAQLLAEMLNKESSIPTALENFDKARRPVNLDYVTRSRALGAYLQAQLMSKNERVHAQLHRNADEVLRETANPHI